METARQLPVHHLPAWRVLLAIGGIYAAQGLVGAIAFRGVPAVLREHGVALDRIGLMSLVMLPWALKFLWAPWIERYRLPAEGPNRSGRIIVPGQVAICLVLLGLAAVTPGTAPALVLVLLGLIALCSATVDIACDGFAVEQLRRELRGLGNTMQVGGSYLGFLIGGGAFLLLVSTWSWEAGIIAMAAIVLLLSLPATTIPELRTQAEPRTHRPSLAYAWARPEVRIGLGVVVAFQLGLRLGQGMLTPFLVDRGFDLATLGLLFGAVGTVASVAGTAVAGLLLRRYDGDRVLIGCLILQFFLLVAFTAASVTPDLPREILAGLMLAKGAAAAAGFVALYTRMMGWSSLRQAGIDFTLFQCGDAGVAAVTGILAGLLAQHYGYRACFAAAACLSLSALVVVPLLLRRIAAHRIEADIT
jgi:MFS transporter (putative signal transducer)